MTSMNLKVTVRYYQNLLLVLQNVLSHAVCLLKLLPPAVFAQDLSAEALQYPQTSFILQP